MESGSSILRINTTDIMYMGISFSHEQKVENMSARQSRRLPSSIGFAATCGVDPRQVLGEYCYTDGHKNEEVSVALKSMTQLFVNTYKKNRKGGNLKKIILYVSGYSENQIEFVS